jgi:U3 small nucleolar RNA-associated protein 12
MRTALIPLRKHLRTALERQKEVIGYNLAGLQYIRKRNAAERTVQFFEEGQDVEEAQMKIMGPKKRKRVDVKA